MHLANANIKLQDGIVGILNVFSGGEYCAINLHNVTGGEIVHV